MQLRLRSTIAFCSLVLCCLLFSGCGPTPGTKEADHAPPRTLNLALSRIKTLDPALADDVASGLAVGHLYDRLLQYDYQARPYRLMPAMATALPDIGTDGRTVTFHLRRDLQFSDDACFNSPAARAVTARDVVFSLLRLADARLHSPGYWIIRDKIVGLSEFRKATTSAPPIDLSPYDAPVAGLRAPDPYTVVFTLTEPYPQLLNVLAMPFASVVSETACRHYGAALAEHAVGCGSFLLADWRRNYAFTLKRNPGYRQERDPLGRGYLPLLDEVRCFVVQEPLTAWLLFLQGNLDQTAVGQENLEAALQGGGNELLPDLRSRGVTLTQTPEYQINYVGFNARDPLLGTNRKLRQAITLAYDFDKRIELSRRQLIAAQGPIPPGVAGYDPAFRNPYNQHQLERARQLLADAGFPGGIDPDSGKPLRLRFDLGGTDLTRRQQAELFAIDMKQIGIEIEPGLNNWPRFLAKLKQGDVQLFRVAWVGDYPDGQNFLQLFYSANAGGCNRAYYRNPDFDRLYEEAIGMMDGAERTNLYREMQQLLVEDCPWIFESYPVTFRLVQPWVSGYIPHHFSNEQWKYIAIDPVARNAQKRDFRPLRLTAQ